MKITLITTLAELKENKRIEDEAHALGHDFELLDISDFSFTIKNSNLHVNKLTNLKTDILIIRGIFLSIKPILESINALKLQNKFKIFDNNIMRSQFSINKKADLVLLASSNIPIPDTFSSRSFHSYMEEAETLGYPLVVKSVNAGKGSGIYKLNSKDDLEVLIEGLEARQKEAKGYIMQQFIKYKHDLRVLVIGDSIYTMKRIPQKGEFRANYSLGGSVQKFDLSEEGRHLALRALSAVNLKVGGVDILIDENDKMYVLEVNHVAGMVGMELALGENIVKKYLEFAISEAI